MIEFTRTPILGLLIIHSKIVADNRGSFNRLFCAPTFAAYGLNFTVNNTNISRNIHKHTLRGMHFQTAPYEETKIVQCVAGKIFDVIVDLRPNSLSYLQHFALELSQQAGNGLFVPAGCAHGFMTLEDHSDVLYHIDTVYNAQSASGVRWNDPVFDIQWPAIPKIISEKDQNWDLIAQ